jgi:hypothetical protein
MDSTSEQQPVAKPPTRLVDIPVTSQAEALNMIVSFVNLAQKRGAFTIDESAKIWESIKFFTAPASTTD